MDILTFYISSTKSQFSRIWRTFSTSCLPSNCSLILESEWHRPHFMTICTFQLDPEPPLHPDALASGFPSPHLDDCMLTSTPGFSPSKGVFPTQYPGQGYLPDTAVKASGTAWPHVLAGAASTCPGPSPDSGQLSPTLQHLGLAAPGHTCLFAALCSLEPLLL